MRKNPLTRREFVRLGTGAVAIGAAVQTTLLQPLRSWADVAAGAKIRFASIGTGVRGCELLKASLLAPGVECVAVSDLYDGRLRAARESVQKDVFTTRNYKEILDRKDIDAVIVATPDHQHRPIAVDAFDAGKDVYCEKPMSHDVEDGNAMVAAAQKGNRILQAGSQRVSSVIYAKAKEIYDSGKLGDVYAIEAHSDRNSASGAWVYPVPPDANEHTIDWNGFLGSAPKRPFDAVRFFRWRCFADYGEGLAGDLFVHLISGIHHITGTTAPPSRALSTGGLYRWKDGREFPDLIQTMYDYPSFNVQVRCNLNNEAGEDTTFYGTKGTMVVGGSRVTWRPQDTRPKPEGYSIGGWPTDLRNQYMAQWYTEHPSAAPLTSKTEEEGESFTAPPNYNDTADHVANFFQAVRTRVQPVENGKFGNNASIACHLANHSYFHKTAAVWDSAAKRIKA